MVPFSWSVVTENGKNFLATNQTRTSNQTINPICLIRPTLKSKRQSKGLTLPVSKQECGGTCGATEIQVFYNFQECSRIDQDF